MNIKPGVRAGMLALTAALATVATASAQTYHATIVTEDGSPLPTSPQIIPDLSDRLVQECAIVNIFGNGSVQYLVNLRSRAYDPATADVCSVTIRLKGYRSAQVTLRNDATIVLKRVGLHEGSTVSATSLNAPEPARKAYGKGVNAMTTKNGPRRKRISRRPWKSILITRRPGAISARCLKGNPCPPRRALPWKKPCSPIRSTSSRTSS